MKMSAIVVALLLLASAAFPQSRPTPFGFHVGMTKAEVVAAVGEKNVRQETTDPTFFWLKSAPTPSREFNEYTVLISPKLGVYTVSAMVDVTTNRSGEQVREKYADIKNLLVARYGKPTNDFDFVHPGALFREDTEFMMSLKQKERSLVAAWVLPDKTNISLEAIGLSIDKASILLIYQFEPEFSAAKAEKDKREQDVL